MSHSYPPISKPLLQVNFLFLYLLILMAMLASGLITTDGNSLLILIPKLTGIGYLIYAAIGLMTGYACVGSKKLTITSWKVYQGKAARFLNGFHCLAGAAILTASYLFLNTESRVTNIFIPGILIFLLTIDTPAVYVARRFQREEFG